MFSGLIKLFRHGGDEPPKFDDNAVVFTIEYVDDRFGELDETLDAVDLVDVDEVSPAFHGQDASPLQDFWNRLESLGDAAAGSVFGIEYKNAKGEKSARRIRLHRLYQDEGVVYLRAYCFERRAARTFRYDRILSVFDMDGVIHDDIQGFLSVLGVDFETTPVKPDSPSPMPDRPGMGARRVARDGLRALVALARADGLLHDEEIEVIKQYIAYRAEFDDVFVDDNDLDALDAYLRRQHPSAAVLTRCLDGIEREPPNLQRLFLTHAIALADADGIQHEAEFEMLMELQQRLGT